MKVEPISAQGGAPTILTFSIKVDEQQFEFDEAFGPVSDDLKWVSMI